MPMYATTFWIAHGALPVGLGPKPMGGDPWAIGRGAQARPFARPGRRPAAPYAPSNRTRATSAYDSGDDE